MDTYGQESLLYRGVLYVEVILYSKECNWYTRCYLLNGGVRYKECPLREAIPYTVKFTISFNLKIAKSSNTKNKEEIAILIHTN